MNFAASNPVMPSVVFTRTKVVLASVKCSKDCSVSRIVIGLAEVAVMLSEVAVT